VFYYGAPTSGRMAHGVLFNANLHRPAWRTGGTFGAEAGIPNLILLGLWFLDFHLFLKPSATSQPIQAL